MTKDNEVRERIKKGLALIAITYKVGIEDLIKAKTMTCDIPVGTRLKGLVSFELDDLEAFILQEVQRGKEGMLDDVLYRLSFWEPEDTIADVIVDLTKLKHTLSPEGKETKV